MVSTNYSRFSDTKLWSFISFNGDNPFFFTKASYRNEWNDKFRVLLCLFVQKVMQQWSLDGIFYASAIFIALSHACSFIMKYVYYNREIGNRIYA